MATFTRCNRCLRDIIDIDDYEASTTPREMVVFRDKYPDGFTVVATSKHRLCHDCIVACVMGEGAYVDPASVRACDEQKAAWGNQVPETR